MNLYDYNTGGETEKGHVTNAARGTKQYTRSSQWVVRLKELRGGSNHGRQVIEKGFVLRMVIICLLPKRR